MRSVLAVTAVILAAGCGGNGTASSPNPPTRAQVAAAMRSHGFTSAPAGVSDRPPFMKCGQLAEVASPVQLGSGPQYRTNSGGSLPRYLADVMILRSPGAVSSCAAAIRRSPMWREPVRVSAAITYHPGSQMRSPNGRQTGVYAIIRSRGTLLATGEAFTRSDAIALDKRIEATLRSVPTS